MNALPNAHTQRDSQWSPHAGPTSSVPPEVLQSQNGVSSDYIPKEGHHWFVIRVVYNRTKKAYDIISNAGVQFYVPMHYAIKKEIGKKKRILRPLLPNFFFVYTTRKNVDLIIRTKNDGLSIVKYYLDKTKPVEANGKHPPLIIPFHSMINFIKVTSTESEYVRIVTSEQCHYKSGDLVRVIGGKFQGVVGKVARIAGQQRVVVEISGLCMVATAYIPTGLIEPFK